MSYIFISYSRKDRDYARKVADYLLDAGYDIWIDDRIDFGENWERAIFQAIDNCGAFLVIMTPDSYDSVWVQRECHHAEKRGKAPFPLLLKGEEFPRYGLTQYADARNGNLPPEEFLHRLANFVPRDKTRGREIVTPQPSNSSATTSLLHGQTIKALVKPVAHNSEWVPRIEVIDGIEMVLVPPGSFQMGNETGEADERPVHQQTFEYPFWISRFAITNEQYRAAVKAGACKPPRDNGWFNDPSFHNHPVTFISWLQAKEFAQWHQCRLPTEMEWEYAARGPDNLYFAWGNRFDAQQVVYRANANGQPASVDAKKESASWVGAAQMNGNIWEWTSSIYRPYPYLLSDGRENEEIETLRVLRGGSWWEKEEQYLRSTFRYGADQNYRDQYKGFRVVRSLLD
ncbi:MAG: SUMF1/EgtB/PvdO family nonheme iron enzyme [Anaerolineae bacterium]|nr:SUMF1/EgtB/PvdO family nonheme iron enzyme [Anaerolineae bacterium]